MPTDAISLAEIEAVNWLLLRKVVGRASPFHCTMEPLTNFVPVTVKVKAVPPAGTLGGEREVIAGRRIVMLKLRALEVPPPGVGLNTLT